MGVLLAAQCLQPSLPRDKYIIAQPILKIP